MQSSITLYDKVLANIFFLLFTSPILSPALGIGGGLAGSGTFSLYWLIFLIDFKFQAYVKYILKNKIPFYGFASAVLLAFWCCILSEYMVLIRCIIIILTVAYVKYAFDGKLFYLFRWINFNIVIAICQYITNLYVPAVATLLSPTNIAYMLWGSYARLTFNNVVGAFSDEAFEDNILVSLLGFEPIRVSGLSGEGGFLASLLVMTWLIAYLYTNNRKQLVILSLGLVLSLSKITFLLPILLVVIKLKPYIVKIPFEFMVIGIGVVLNLVSSWTLDNLFLSETFMHRFGGYYAVNFMDWNNMLFGIPRSVELNPMLFSGLDNIDFFPYKYNSMSGYADFVHHIGYVGLFIWLLTIRLLGINSYGLLFIVLGTITLNLETVIANSILAWFLACDFKLTPARKTGGQWC